MKQKAILIVLDGFGIGKESKFNAISNARKPFFNTLLNKYPHSQLMTHGKAVGLPDGVMGNSEVGHMTMGAGRIIYQDLTRISNDITQKTFFNNTLLNKTIEAGAKKTGRIHLMGLLSDGGVHSHIEHLEALLTLCLEKNVPNVFVHAFLDGRDTPPDSSRGYIERLQRHPSFKINAKVASLCGRYYAMDRDKRWERVKKAYDCITGHSAETPLTPEHAIQASYQNGKTDEFFDPLLLNANGAIQSGDSLIFFNYRSDRARELTSCFVLPDFNDFKREKTPVLSAFAGMTQYDSKLPAPFIYGPQNTDLIFPELLENKNLKQFRIAETEKYAHVTFFFNAGREAPFKGEDRVLIPSPKEVATYDLKPEMSAFEVAEEAKKRIEQLQYDFVLMNFANADMVGHTGNYEAAVKAIETLDQCLEKVVGAAEKAGYHTLITADHGNAEEMCDHDDKPHTQHTLNPVPAIWVAPKTSIAPKESRIALNDGGLSDLMPTLCDLMNIEIPKLVTGKSLIPKGVKP